MTKEEGKNILNLLKSPDDEAKKLGLSLIQELIKPELTFEQFAQLFERPYSAEHVSNVFLQELWDRYLWREYITYVQNIIKEKFGYIYNLDIETYPTPTTHIFDSVVVK